MKLPRLRWIAARLRQRLAQPRDVHLQALTRPRRRVLAPQFIDQPLAGRHAAAHQRQYRQQRARPLAAKRDLSAVHPRLDRTEQLDPKPTSAVDAGQPCPSSRVTRLYAHPTVACWRAVGGPLARPPTLLP